MRRQVVQSVHDSLDTRVAFINTVLLRNGVLTPQHPALPCPAVRRCEVTYGAKNRRLDLREHVEHILDA